MAGVAEGRADPREREVTARTRRTAFVLLGWIILLVIASVIVVWVRN